MSAALINRSLTTIRTELEFLRDSEVIDDSLYEKLLTSIPTKYQKDMQPWGADRLAALPANESTVSVPSYQPPSQQASVAQLSNDLSKTSLAPAPAPVAAPITAPIAAPSAPPRLEPSPVGYCKAIYDYQSQEQDDLSLTKEDKIAVTEHLSEDWWKGYKQNDGPDRQGVFPSNYVNVISQQEFEAHDRKAAARPPPPSEKASYTSNDYQPPPPQYNNNSNSYLPPAQPLQQQPSYGGYAQYPPPSTNFYPPQQQQQYPPQQPQQVVVEQQQQQQPHEHSQLRKFGGKLGNAAIFGAGATIGSDIVNSIF